jgi:hypothetical protein
MGGTRVSEMASRKRELLAALEALDKRLAALEERLAASRVEAERDVVEEREGLDETLTRLARERVAESSESL